MAYVPYNPCDDCKQKGKLCNKCALTNLGINYNRALEEIVRLSATRERLFFDIETREIITEEILAETLVELKECNHSDYGNITLEQYINNCLTINNGTLEEI